MKFLLNVGKRRKHFFIKTHEEDSTLIKQNENAVDTVNYEINMLFDQEKDLVRSPCFYWPDLGHKDSEELLKSKADGTFLVRKSSHPTYKYAVTYKRDGVVASARIQFCSETLLYSFNFANMYLPREYTIRELVASVAGHGIPMRREDGTTEAFSNMQLESPLHRTVSLMEHCKVCILENYPNNEDIDELGRVLPKSLIKYLKE